MVEACLPSLYPQPKPFPPAPCPQSLSRDKKTDCKAHRSSSQGECSGSRHLCPLPSRRGSRSPWAHRLMVLGWQLRVPHPVCTQGTRGRDKRAGAPTAHALFLVLGRREVMHRVKAPEHGRQKRTCADGEGARCWLRHRPAFEAGAWQASGDVSFGGFLSVIELLGVAHCPALCRHCAWCWPPAFVPGAQSPGACSAQSACARGQPWVKPGPWDPSELLCPSPRPAPGSLCRLSSWLCPVRLFLGWPPSVINQLLSVALQILYSHNQLQISYLF